VFFKDSANSRSVQQGDCTTNAMEAVRGIVLDLIEEAVTSGRWQARLLNE